MMVCMTMTSVRGADGVGLAHKYQFLRRGCIAEVECRRKVWDSAGGFSTGVSTTHKYDSRA